MKRKIYAVYTPGKNYFISFEHISKIEEHQARGEGDKWFYDVHFVNGEMVRVFSATKVEYGAQE